MRMIGKLGYTMGNDMIKLIECSKCGFQWDIESIDDEECQQCQLKEVRAKNGMEISALKNKIFQLKLKLECAK